MLRWLVDLLRPAPRAHASGKPATREEDLEALIREGYERHGRGDLDGAEATYRRVLLRQADNADVNYLLGEIAQRRGAHGSAIEYIGKAIAARPDVASFHFTMGCALQDERRLDEAVASYRRALALEPGYAEARNNLGNAYRARGELEAAIECYEAALAARPELFGTHVNLGDVFKELGRYADAIRHYRAALDLQPGLTDVRLRLGIVLVLTGQTEEALEVYERLVRLRPDLAAGHANRGVVLRMLGRIGEAIEALERALRIEANDADAQSNLGTALSDLGRHAEAEACYRRALALEPSRAKTHGNLLLSLNYRGDVDPGEVYREHRAWAERHARGLAASAATHANDRSSERRLRIGYVSPDFLRHSVAYFALPVLAAHDRAQFEVVCFSDVTQRDDVTSQFRKLAAEWHDIFGMSDAEVADLVRLRAIDILVDLAGHTGKNRMLAFARKPAPVQVTWLGYPNTTGLEAMDYRFTDAVADPEGLTERYHTERLVRLRDGFLCYRPPVEAPGVAEPPLRRSGRATFGCFNNLAKVTPQAIAAWARILQALPGSRLMLKARGLSSADTRRSLLDRFAGHGVGAGQLDIFGPDPSLARHLERYGEVDVALDVFPYNGTTTTCEALWMGVPVVTLSGRVHACRVGASILHRIGLAELVASGEDAYVQAAVELASDAQRLGALRQGLRERMRSSPLLDAAAITRQIESAYRSMWQRWCARGSA